MTDPDQLAWFGGDEAAVDLYARLVYVAHAWDDLVDQDKPVAVDRLMIELLVYLPGNPFYARYAGEIRSLMLASAVGYMAANKLQGSCDEHKVEIAHYLRYAIVNVVSFMLAVIHGPEAGAQVLSEIAHALIPERLDEFMKEHLPCL